MNRILRISAILVATVSLSGCQAIGSFWAKLTSQAPRETVETSTALAAAENMDLSAGRELLGRGMYAAAITSFRNARSDPAAFAEANNGMGVAYAKLGRLDLAERYFQVALTLDPSNERFAANMLRLQRDYALAKNKQHEAELLAQAEAAKQAAAEKLAQADETGNIERVSRGEVRITTLASPMAAPIATVAARDAIPPAKLPEITAGEAAEGQDIDAAVAADQSKSISFN